MLKIIIEKAISNSFYIYLQGHAPNELFKECLTGRFSEYKQALAAAEMVANTVNAISYRGKFMQGVGQAQVYVNEYGQSDMQAYAKRMAFNPLQVIKD